MRKVINLLLPFCAATFLIGNLFHSTKSAEALTWVYKVDPLIMETAVNGNEVEFLVYLNQQADLSGAAFLSTKLEKGTYVYERLTEVARTTQVDVITTLEKQGADYKPYWIANMIWVRGNVDVVQAAAQHPDVAHIFANPAVTLALPVKAEPDELRQTPLAIEWNLTLVNAPAVWAAGYRGQGVVIGGQDTGYDWDHPALIGQYRGWNGGTVIHDYNWHDAIHTSGSICPPDGPEPCDDNSHGTHTMGTMVGDDGGSNQIGMAPDAKWISCRNMKQGWGTPATYAECYQWFIAPTDLNSQNPDPAKSPHVINNSWACPPVEGCTDPNVLLSVVNNVRAAGIVTVHSAGNDGSGCGSVKNPAAIYDASFSVGATDIGDRIASFSSRGPVTIDGSNRLKPDISAPGVSVRSSVPGTGYSYKSGTSMAGPHVAGLVALIISADPSLAGDVDAIEGLIQQTAIPLTTTQGCGGDGPTDVPNHVYGYGRIDALAALQQVTNRFQINKTTNAEIAPGQTLSYSINLTHLHSLSPTHNVVVTDRIPSNSTFVTATLPFTFDGDMVQWDIPSLAADATWTATLVVGIPITASGSIVNTDYAVRSDEMLVPVMGSPVNTTIVAPNLALTKTAVTFARLNEIFTYTLSVTNSNLFAWATQLVLTDTLSDNVQFITATHPHTLDGRKLQWDLARLDAGDTWTVNLVVKIPITASESIVNTDYAIRSHEIPVPVMGSPVTTTIVTPDLALTKTAVAFARLNEIFTYTLSVTNSNLFAWATQLVLTDTLSDNVQFITATHPHTLDGRKLQWDLARLDAGDTWTVNLVVKIPITASESIVNTDYAIRSNEIPVPVMGSPVTTTIVTPDLALTKTAVIFARPNEIFTYTLSVTNSDPFAWATQLVLTDTIPDNVNFITATLPYSLDDGILQWDLAHLDTGDSWVVNLVIQAPSSITTTVVENRAYGLTSAEIMTPITAPPVTTLVFKPYLYYYPIFFGG